MLKLSFDVDDPTRTSSTTWTYAKILTMKRREFIVAVAALLVSRRHSLANLLAELGCSNSFETRRIEVWGQQLAREGLDRGIIATPKPRTAFRL